MDDDATNETETHHDESSADRVSETARTAAAAWAAVGETAEEHIRLQKLADERAEEAQAVAERLSGRRDEVDELERRAGESPDDAKLYKELQAKRAEVDRIDLEHRATVAAFERTVEERDAAEVARAKAFDRHSIAKAAIERESFAADFEANLDLIRDACRALRAAVAGAESLVGVHAAMDQEAQRLARDLGEPYELPPVPFDAAALVLAHLFDEDLEPISRAAVEILCNGREPEGGMPVLVPEAGMWGGPRARVNALIKRLAGLEVHQVQNRGISDADALRLAREGRLRDVYNERNRQRADRNRAHAERQRAEEEARAAEQAAKRMKAHGLRTDADA